MTTSQACQATADALRAKAGLINEFPALIGFDGFIDEIVRLIDKKEGQGVFSTIPTIAALAERLARAAGKSTNIEMVVQQIKLGGNGPIMANAMATLGLPITYIGNLGYPEIHPVFVDFAKIAKVFSIAEPGHTDALEFDDGKIMLGKYQMLDEVNYETIVKRIGHGRFDAIWQQSKFVGIVNWTMITHMTAIWRQVLENNCRPAAGEKGVIFFDLADPEKRLEHDLRQALETIGKFSRYYRVVLGCNEKESTEIAQVLGLGLGENDLENLQKRAQKIREFLEIDTVVIHPVKFAVAASAYESTAVLGPFTPQPKISTGAGDHFNAGFCLGKLLNFDLSNALRTGVATSGFYVRNAASPAVADLIDFLQQWAQTPEAA